MDRSYAAGATGSAPTAPASPSTGYPTAGNPGTGTPATKPGPYWYHMIMEELMAIISAGGITPAPGTLNQVKLALDALYMNRGYMLLTDEKAQGTNGGSSVLGTQTRTLNTVRANTISGASLASNQFTLPAGTYRIRARAPSEQTDNNRIYLTNVTDTTFPIMGSSEQGGTTGELFVSHATLVGRITISAAKVFEIRHYTGLAVANVGLGRMTSVAGVEVYTEVEIIKEA